jgi:hypothetical protein
MVRHKIASGALATAMLFGSGTLVACDKEDKQDVEEVGDEVDKQLDKLDTDGKDD